MSRLAAVAAILMLAVAVLYGGVFALADTGAGSVHHRLPTPAAMR